MLTVEDLSAWRRFRALEKPNRRRGRPRKHPELNQSYGFPVEVIAESCAMSRFTAYGYKTGRLNRPKPAQNLFVLYRDEPSCQPSSGSQVAQQVKSLLIS